MSKIKTLTKLITSPGKIIQPLGARGLLNWIPDRLYLKLLFRGEMGKKLDLNQPITFNEKLQWLKLYDRRPIYQTLVDKNAVKQYISEKIGKEYTIPTLGIWEKAEEISFDSLPNQFVLKCTHDSGGIVIVKDKSQLDQDATRKKLNKSLKRNFYDLGREWPYKQVKPQIIAEAYIEDTHSEKHELTDYKFYCFNGYADCVMMCFDRASDDTKFYFFDRDWKLKRINQRGKCAPSDFSLPKPERIDDMFILAAKLSEGFPFVRVDLYQSGGNIYFGEMTLYPQSGLDPNYLPETDIYFGNLIDLSLAYKEQS